MPWPADYGGVIDIYYRLLALHKAGVHITLHCFTYGRDKAPELEDCCDQVFYYRRNMSPWQHLRKTPFIAASRDNDSLIHRLMKDDAPILIEGLHSCELLRRIRQAETTKPGSHRTILVRAHNVEADYYHLLARSERNPMRKTYLALEACKLRHYEPVLQLADAVLAITDADADIFRKMGCPKVFTIPPFIPLGQIETTDSSNRPTPNAFPQTPYILYHADLSIPDNEWAVRWLQRKVMRYVNCPFVVAGRNPRGTLRNYLSRYPNTTLVVSPSQEEMESLIAGAQCAILLTRQPTGLKLKLVNSLVLGQHCIVNSAMVAGTNLADCCHVADSAEEIRQKMDELMHTPFDEEQRQRRQSQLARLLNPVDAIQQLVQLIK